MKILKRNQLIILVISLMLITSGYLNFTANKEKIVDTIANRSDTKIGDAEFVSTIPKEENTNEVGEINDDNRIINDTMNQINTEETTIENQNKNEIATSVTQEDNYFITSKLERNNMYSENLETYQEIYNNTNATQESKKEALSKINNINNTKNAIMIAENLIIAKGFNDVVIFVNEGSVSVVIKAEELKQEEVAQIQNIVSRELNVGAEVIHISNKI